jgi:hypothetical protein
MAWHVELELDPDTPCKRWVCVHRVRTSSGRP